MTQVASAAPGLTGREGEGAGPVRALLLHTAPGEVMDVLRACPGLEWAAATSAGEVQARLVEHDPEVVLSIKTSEFPGPAHAAALEWGSVRWFHVGGSGHDHLPAWDPARVTVTDSAGVLAPFLAERALAGLLALATGLPEHMREQARARWSPTRFRPLAGRTLLVVGLGRTGAELARRARALGMSVLGVRASGAPHPDADEVHRPEALRDLLPRADVLSLHVRLTPETTGLVGAPELALLPRGALVLNAARGAVLGEGALLEALERNVAGAWLDVFEEEPLPEVNPLWRHPRILVTPHCADQAEDFPARFAARFRELWVASR